ncbi:MAG: GHKL domain-containing protein [Anaerocolumna aminovalerica]|jgi:two-component system sensor histidine kinase AgrC|uniref:sensor histidine kinase n=1 Tax=Bacillota TaxID=1239 RepID=UPI000BE3A545|nr:MULTISPECIES: sensor histidine kinase [Bacillota]MDU6266060.1 GHKL domain-containing protein [Anaerocolumna aminovalerica]
MNSYDYVFLISNALGTYTVFKFMCIFFERTKEKRMFEIISYMVYFLVSSYVHLVIHIPIITFTTNIIAFFLLTFNYKANFKRRVISTIYMYVILMTVELVMVVLTGYIDLSVFSVDSQYSSIAGIMSIKLFSYIIVLIIQNYKNIKKGIDVPNSYWLSLFIIPFGTLYVTFLILESNNLSNYRIVISVSILLIINIVAFYLYDVLNSVYEDKIEKALLKQQNNYYHKQFEIMDNSYKNMKSVRHDIKNHLSIIESYIYKNNTEKAINYIQNILNSSYGEQELARSGNFDFDSILNYKLQNAKSKGIEVIVEAKIPQKINIESFDIAIIIGNLLDNAFEAVSKLSNDKKIKVRLNYRKNTLYIHVNNTFDGAVFYEDDQIISTHKDKENHGIGLKNIEKAIKKYNGTMEINHTNNNFTVDIFLYIN